MRLITSLLFFPIFISCNVWGNDTLYFRLSNPWNTVKSPTGAYLRKAVKELDYYHVWDYNNRNLLVTESFYTDTNFTRKLFCHKYFNEEKSWLEQTRCYENGRLNGYFVGYNERGDITFYELYDNSVLVKEWSDKPKSNKSVASGIEETAEFPGGKEAWLKYIGEKLVYPDSLKSIKGQVIVQFIVNQKGNVESVEIIKGLHPVLDSEVVRLMQSSPAWKPAKQNGKNVKAFRRQPITFQ